MDYKCLVVPLPFVIESRKKFYLVFFQHDLLGKLHVPVTIAQFPDDLSGVGLIVVDMIELACCKI